MTSAQTSASIDEYLRERLMPVEGAIPQIPGIEMYGNSGYCFRSLDARSDFGLGSRSERWILRVTRRLSVSAVSVF